MTTRSDVGVNITDSDGKKTRMFLTESELRSRIDELRGYDRLTKAQSEELGEYRAGLTIMSENKDRIRSLADNPAATERVSTPSAPASEPVRRGREQHRRAMVAIERSRLLDDNARSVVAGLVEADPTSVTADVVAATSSEHYARAFAKVMADPMSGHRSFSTEEGYAWAEADRMRALTTVTGDALIPTHLDPAVMLSSDGSVDPMRQLARVVQLSVGGTWHGVSSAGVTAEWKAEGVEAADATPTFDDPDVPTHKANAYVEATIEAVQDAASFQSELGRLLADAKMQHEAPAFVSGTGVNQPTGLITGLAAGQTVATATVAAFADEDVYALIEALPARFRQNATWLAALGILNTIDQFETANGAKKFPELGSERLLRKPVREHSELSENIATGQHIAVVGDFRNFVIADRLGAAVEFIPHVMGANRRPTGTRGFYYRWRVGGAPVVPAAFRRLAVA